ncbi:NRAMP family divalent metal transporter [Ornithinicoccus halotolerans]|uniref:NRAMP family divalent metal transporter n=1 Tax=Ornithinicoccus halotolerans TaxID=1748220 RepID=UPI001294EA95|nr:divalent metal cation transporter [Ornithinicoccus halotolerans]
MSQSTAAPTSRGERPWRDRLAALGPGILLASAAIGGSHLVSSTQAGAQFGWQLVVVLVLANLLKYPFFRFGPQYTMESGRSLVEGYARRGRGYLWVFFVLCLVASVVSTAGVGLLGAVILSFALPDGWGLGVPILAVLLMVASWALLVAGRYRMLDRVTKVIVVALAVGTVVATLMAAARGPAAPSGFAGPSPWTLVTLPFLVALMGWMPAPIELSALNSLWIRAKQRITPSAAKDVLLDFNVGYVTSAVLAVFFLALGALVQFGTGVEVAQQGGAYIPQLLQMYGSAIGGWAVPIVAVVAFACMFGTTITVVDGYARACAESVRLLRHQERLGQRALTGWITGIAAVGLVIIVGMADELADMLWFAMVSAFVTAPVFAWLNYTLVRSEHGLSPTMRWLSWAGLAYLVGFTLLFLLVTVGVLG